MKLFTIAFLFSQIVFAQEPPAGNAPNQPWNQLEGNAYHQTVDKKEKPQKRQDIVKGICAVIPGGGNLMTAPCSDVVLTLTPKKGEAVNTRVERDGSFEFTIEQGQAYKLSAASKFYDVVFPTELVRATYDLKIQLRQK